MDDVALTTRVVEVLDRWPSAGVAVGVIRDGTLAWFHGQGVADVESNEPVTEDTVFRIGSVTKTFTAIAVMQLSEQGRVNLDAPASDYLRTFRLVPARAGLRPVTVRHLLTHTAGIGYWRRFADLLRPGVGSGVSGRSAPPLADYYRRGLPVEVEPGTKWVYSNHGFATLGQIVEDVSGRPFDRYLRDHVFGPLGMEHTDLVRSDRVKPGLATGYMLRSRGLQPVADREVPLAAGGGAYSTTRDMARYVAALLGGGTNEHGSVVNPETLASMYAPYMQSDPRVPGMGLSFELGEEGGHRTAAKGGVLSGFLSQMTLAPDDGIGILAFANTGGLDGRGAAEPLALALVRHLLELPADAIRTDIPARPENWSGICGWYGMEPGPLTNLFDRLLFGAGAEVMVRHGHLLLRPLTPIPALRTGFRLHPDEADDPYVFRIDFSGLGKGTFRVAFSRGAGDGTAGVRLHGLGMQLRKRPDALNPRLWANGALTAFATALAVHRRGMRARRRADARYLSP